MPALVPTLSPACTLCLTTLQRSQCHLQPLPLFLQPLPLLLLPLLLLLLLSQSTLSHLNASEEFLLLQPVAVANHARNKFIVKQQRAALVRSRVGSTTHMQKQRWCGHGWVHDLRNPPQVVQGQKQKSNVLLHVKHDQVVTIPQFLAVNWERWCCTTPPSSV